MWKVFWNTTWMSPLVCDISKEEGRQPQDNSLYSFMKKVNHYNKPQSLTLYEG